MFEQFWDKCKLLDPSMGMEIIIKEIWKKFNKASKNVCSQDFIALVKEAITNISDGPYTPQMKIVSDNLKHNKVKFNLN